MSNLSNLSNFISDRENRVLEALKKMDSPSGSAWWQLSDHFGADRTVKVKTLMTGTLNSLVAKGYAHKLYMRKAWRVNTKGDGK